MSAFPCPSCRLTMRFVGKERLERVFAERLPADFPVRLRPNLLDEKSPIGLLSRRLTCFSGRFHHSARRSDGRLWGVCCGSPI